MGFSLTFFENGTKREVKHELKERISPRTQMRHVTVVCNNYSAGTSGKALKDF